MTNKIAVTGTGLTGLTLALSLAQAGFDMTLIGPDASDAQDNRTTAIMADGISFLERLGVWAACAAQVTPLEVMELVDGPNRHVFRADAIGLRQFGFNVANDALKKALNDKIGQTPKIERVEGTLARAERSASGWILETKNGKNIQAALLIGADGRNSFVRDIAAIPQDVKEESQMALVAMLQAEQPHDFTSVEWYRAGGPFTLVPVRNTEFALVWCDDADILRDKTSLMPRKLGVEITAITQARFGKITLTSPPEIFPVRPAKAKRLIADKLALVGEAAHTLPPIGAQGFNASLADLRALVDSLVKGKSLGLAVNDATILSLYEDTRLRDISLRYHGMTGLNDLIRTQHPMMRKLRRFSLGMLDRLPPAKTALMRFGLGTAEKGRGK